MEKLESEKLRYVACIFCGKSVHTSVLSEKTFKSYSPDWSVLQFREVRGGRGHGGFFQIGGLSLKEMLKSKDPEIKILAKNVIARFKLIHSAWEKEGLL